MHYMRGLVFRFVSIWQVASISHLIFCYIFYGVRCISNTFKRQEKMWEKESSDKVKHIVTNARVNIHSKQGFFFKFWHKETFNGCMNLLCMWNCGNMCVYYTVVNQNDVLYPYSKIFIRFKSIQVGLMAQSIFGMRINNTWHVHNGKEKKTKTDDYRREKSEKKETTVERARDVMKSANIFK